MNATVAVWTADLPSTESEWWSAQAGSLREDLRTTVTTEDVLDELRASALVAGRPVMTYEATAASGTSQYADVLQALADAGHNAEFTQTAGTCAALGGVPLSEEPRLLDDHGIVLGRGGKECVLAHQLSGG